MNKKLLTITLIVFGMLLLEVVVAMFLYKDFSPKDQSAATRKTYYLAPDGSDQTGDGSLAKPWKTITKANSMVSSGDTVIFKDGIYDVNITDSSKGYTISKSGTTWKAENKHKAVLDGGLGPDLFSKPQDAPSVYKQKFSDVPKSLYSRIIGIRDSSNVAIEGLVIANAPGRGISVGQSESSIVVENIIIKDVWFDFIWDHAFNVTPSSKNNYSNVRNIVFENNIVTRASILKLAYDHGNRTEFRGWPRNYGTAGGRDVITRNNIFAWNHGEIGANHGATHHLFENNVVIHSMIAHYIDNNQNVTVRNNIMVTSDALKDQSKSLGIATGNRGVDSVRERGYGQGIPDSFINKNTQIYNNVLIGLGTTISGTHGGETRSQEGIYIGHNTYVGTSKTKSGSGAESNLLAIVKFTGEAKISGIIENNLFVTDQLPRRADTLIAPSTNAWNITARNNIVPSGSEAKGSSFHKDAIVKNNVGVVNPNAVFKLDPPGMFSNRADFRTRLDQDVQYTRNFVKNLHLTTQSPAVNAGSTAGSSKNVTPPIEARTKDFYGHTRDSKPDIGAIEFGGVQTTQSPNPTNTLTPTNTTVPINTIVPQTPTSSHTAVPSASNPQGNICGKADADGDGMFKIYDFGEFAKAYGNGKNACADKSVDYGPCGGRDVNRDGFLNIGDFGTTGTGFAQRYYPKTSCAL